MDRYLGWQSSLNLVWLSVKKENFEFKPVKFNLKTDLVGMCVCVFIN